MAKNIQNKKRSVDKKNKETVFLFTFPFFLLLFAVIICSIISTFADLQKNLNFAVMAVLVGMCEFLSGFVSGKIKRENGIVTGIIYSLPAFVILILISLILNKFSIDLNLLISCAVMLISAAAGGITGVNMKKKFKRGRK